MTRAERGGETAAAGATGGRSPILIVGGGIAGLATAAALARLGHEAHVLERAPGFAEIGAGIQLAPNATRILHALGLLDQVAEGAVFPRRLVLADVHSGATLASLDLGGAFRARYGFPYLVMHRGDLLETLEEACRASGLVTLEACRDVVAVDEVGPGVRARCADGSTHQGGALVGADGLWSQVRPLMSADSPVEAGYVAYRGTLPWDEVAHEMRPDDVVMWIGPQVHFVRYPIRRGELCNQVAVFGSARYRAGATEWGTPEELDRAFQGACPPVRHGLASIGRERWWTMQDREPLDHWTRGAITLIGDAAHPMLQYIAQGACQALEDAAHLAAEVARAPGAPATAFRSYQAARAPRAARVQRTARTWGEICHTDGIGATLRNALLARRGDDDYEDVDWLYGHRPEGEAPSPAPPMATLGTPACPGSGEDP